MSALRWIIKVIRKVLVSLLLLVTIIGAYFLIRGNLLLTRYYHVASHSGESVRIVALTDLHGERFGAYQEHLIKKVLAAKPDIIVMTGDMVERTNIDASLDSVDILTRRLVKIAPVYYVDGNHELSVAIAYHEKYELLNDTLERAGAVHLDNEIVTISVGDKKINICGMTTHYYWDESEQKLSEALRNMQGVNIMLCHYPESILWYKPFGYGGLDVAICGHTHGGLIRVPFKGGLYAPEWSYWPMYDLGEYPIYSDTDWHNYGGGEEAKYLGTMIISGGLAGEHRIPRINNPCEVSVIDLDNNKIQRA